MTPGSPVVRLSEIVHVHRMSPTACATDPLVRGLAHNSRRVQPGDLFVCLRGGKDDGHRHAREAVSRGAVAIVGERPLEGLDGLPQIAVLDSRQALAQLAARFYGEPSARLHLVGVTGTEGKTTTVHLLDAILRAAGVRTGMFGTIVNRVQTRTEPATLTTPESLDLQRLLWECLQAGLTHVVMEGVTENRRIPYREFLRTWARTAMDRVLPVRVVPPDPAAGGSLRPHARGGSGAPRPWAA